MRGRAVGSALGDLIHRSLDFYRGYFAELGVHDLARTLSPYWEAAEQCLPEHAATLAAMAEAAQVPQEELLAVNACEELEVLPKPVGRNRHERCSSFTVVGPGYTILAHNEQWFAADAENVALIVERPSKGVAVVSPTVACCLGAVGMNALGGAQGIDSLTAADERIGVPRVFVSRHALEAGRRRDALRRGGLAGRAGGYAHVLAFRGGGALTIETTATEVAVLEGAGPHTNHYLDSELAALAEQPSEGSLSRYERLRQLLQERSPTSPEEAMEILRDHDSAPQAICKHALPGAPEESAVVFSMVCELESGRMWVAPGNPCETEYDEIELDL
jgi:hypothetical protein